MSSFVLIPGAGGSAWYWHRVVPLLEQAGHEAIAIELPGNDERAGLDEYADTVVRAMGGRAGVILVAQSLGGFTAPLVCARVAVRMLVLVNAMIPLPNEKAGDWWRITGAAEARSAAAARAGYTATFDVDTYFLHDVPGEIVRAGAEEQRRQADVVFAQPCRFDSWPTVATRILVGDGDRFFPREFQARIARERLDLDVDEISGGHLVALSNAEGVAARLLAYDKALP